MKKLVILISNAGTGSNLQAIINATSSNQIHAKIVGVISDKQDAKGLLLAKDANLQTFLCKTKEDLLPLLKTLQPDYIVLAGWKQFIAPNVIDYYPEKILNLHPGAVPNHPETPEKNPDGTDAFWNKNMFTNTAIKNVLKHNASYAASSIHFLTHTFDFGPVLGRTFEKVRSDDTIDSLYTRLKKQENDLYVTVLEKLCNS